MKYFYTQNTATMSVALLVVSIRPKLLKFAGLMYYTVLY